MLNEEKTLGAESPSTEQNNLALAAISYAGSYVTSTISYAMTSTYSYLTTPAPFPPKPSNSRLQTQFKDNIVASIALPERPKLKAKSCKSSVVAPLSTTSMSSSFFSRFYKTSPVEPKKEAIISLLPIKTRKPSKNDVDVKMIALVEKIKSLGKHKDPVEVENIYLEQIDLVKQEIMEHAQRRVDLYFYLLVAVYQQGGRVIKLSTNKQHGVGSLSLRGTNACHDSLFPHVELQYQQSKMSYFWSKIVTPWNLRGTHFEDANNMTMELPEAVNRFDTYLEVANPGSRSGPSKYINKLLKDLNQVSRGEKTPIDAMNSFLKTMLIFFSDFEKKLKKPDGEEKHDSDEILNMEDLSESEEMSLSDSIPESKDVSDDDLGNDKFKFPHAMHRLMRKIWELQKMGTLRAQSDDSYCIDHDYLCSLLRVPPSKILETRQNPSLLLTHYCDMIQKEIFANRSVIGEDRKIKKSSSL